MTRIRYFRQGVAALLLLPWATGLCAAQGAPPAGSAPPAPQAIQKLSRQDPLVKALEAEPAIDPIYDRVDFTSVALVNYGTGQPLALVAPVIGPDDQTSILYACFRPEELSQRGFQRPFLLSFALQNSQALNGKIVAYAPTGRLLGGAVYSGGQMVRQLTPDSVATVQGVSWSCFANCLRSVWGWLPWWLQGVCRDSMESCIESYGADLYACAAAAGCLGGFGASCTRICWR